MRRLTAMLAAVATLSILPATPAFAEGAVVDKASGSCSGIVPDRYGQLTGALVFGSLVIRTNSSWTTLTCHFDLTEEEAPPQNTKASGFPCYTPNVTTDTKINASPGGSMVMTCRLAN